MHKWSYSIISFIAIALLTYAVIPAASPCLAGDSAPALFADGGGAADESAPAGAVPEIFFPEPTHDFGTAPQGEKVSHEFVVKNTGTAPLKLIKAKGS